ncbi:hypothetical protein QJS66_14270 [Kocuria rhizophila]|nr:hypothetical protein QJS66_14270 [Kocuria rhizophila]
MITFPRSSSTGSTPWSARCSTPRARSGPTCGRPHRAVAIACWLLPGAVGAAAHAGELDVGAAFLAGAMSTVGVAAQAFILFWPLAHLGLRIRPALR